MFFLFQPATTCCGDTEGVLVWFSFTGFRYCDVIALVEATRCLVGNSIRLESDWVYRVFFCFFGFFFRFHRAGPAIDANSRYPIFS